jgi:hypothetical protein
MLASDRTASRIVVFPAPSIVINSVSMGIFELTGHSPVAILRLRNANVCRARSEPDDCCTLTTPHPSGRSTKSIVGSCPAGKARRHRENHPARITIGYTFSRSWCSCAAAVIDLRAGADAVDPS